MLSLTTPHYISKLPKEPSRTTRKDLVSETFSSWALPIPDVTLNPEAESME